MRRFCDLHTHSRASDGSLAPAELIELAERKRLAGVALTDHDSLAGLKEAARRAEAFPSLTFIPGIEVSAVFPRGTLHILGLCIDPASAAAARLAEQLRQSREARNPQMIARLRQLGLDITLEDVIAQAGSADPDRRIVGRLHMAAALVAKGHARDVPDAFARYIGLGGPAYVDKERMTPAEVIAAIHDAGGLAVLAHPVHLEYDNFAECERIVRSFVHAGLDGIEAYHSDHRDVDTRFFLDLARRLGLVVTGGSDFHGAAKPAVKLGRPPVPAAVMEALLARAGRKR